GISAVIGPNIGAVILHLTGNWQWLFYINIPIALFLIVMGIYKLEEGSEPSKNKIDMKGVVLLSLTIIAFMVGLTNIDGEQLQSSIVSLDVLPFIALGLVGLVFLLSHEKQLEANGGDPIIAYSLLQKRSFRLTLLLGLLSGGFLATIIFIPSYVQQVLQVSPENAGFWLTPLAIASGIGAGLGGFLTDKIGAKKTIITSGFIGFTGFLLFHSYVEGFWLFFIASTLAGIGLGFLLGAPLNVLISESAREDQYGTSLGTLSLVRQVGLTLFPTLFASFITTGVIKIEPIIDETFGKQLLDIGEFEKGTEYSQIISEINKLEDPYVRGQLLELVANVMKTGFQYMFMTAMLIAIVVVGISMLIRVKNSG